MAIKLLWHKTVQILRYTERKPFNFCAIILLQDYTALDTLLYTLLTLAIIYTVLVSIYCTYYLLIYCILCICTYRTGLT